MITNMISKNSNIFWQNMAHAIWIFPPKSRTASKLFPTGGRGMNELAGAVMLLWNSRHFSPTLFNTPSVFQWSSEQLVFLLSFLASLAVCVLPKPQINLGQKLPFRHTRSTPPWRSLELYIFLTANCIQFHAQVYNWANPYKISDTINFSQIPRFCFMLTSLEI